MDLLLLSLYLFPGALSNHAETGRKSFAEVFSHASSLSFFSRQLAKLKLAAHRDLARREEASEEDCSRRKP